MMMAPYSTGRPPFRKPRGLALLRSRMIILYHRTKLAIIDLQMQAAYKKLLALRKSEDNDQPNP